MIRNVIILATLIAAALHACQIGSNRQYGQKPDPDTESQMLNRIIRYCGYMPKKANHLTKFNAVYDTFYIDQAGKHKIDLMYQDEKKGDTYLLVSRIAPSLKAKRVAIGIKLRMENDSLIRYEEVFRTWKMPEEELSVKGAMLFNKMVAGKDLSPYYPQNSGKEDYIEFPDPQTHFDVNKRRWVSALKAAGEKADPLYQ
ncbi:MAG: hypothetical protein ACK4NS_02125 [Saprospiraceae bacterium]